MRKRTILAAAAVTAICAPAHADEVYFRGLGEVFSAGICFVGDGECHSFASVESVIQDFCQRRPKTIKVAGHSLGASAAMRFVWGMRDCGLKVKAAAFLDPMTHPYDMPSGTRVMSAYSTLWRGVGLGNSDAQLVGGLHVWMTFDGALRARVRTFFDVGG